MTYIMNKNLNTVGLCLSLLWGCNGAEPDRTQLTDYKEKQLQKAQQVEDAVADRVARIDEEINAQDGVDENTAPDP